MRGRGHWRRPMGFTMVELIVVMVLLAILSASAMPKLSNVGGMRDQAWRDDLLSTLRLARSMSLSHRRVMCVSLSGTTATLSVALTRADTGCTGVVSGPDGGSTFADSPQASAPTTYAYVDREAGTTVSLGQAATVYFQPDGRATTSFSGEMSSRNWGWTLTPVGVTAITLEGASGYAY